MDADSSNSLQNLQPEVSKIELKAAGTVICVLEGSESSFNDSLKPSQRFKKLKKKRGFKDLSVASTSSVASCCSSSSSCYSQKGVRLGLRRRVSKVKFGAGRGRGSAGDVEAIALPLGMSFAAVVAQVIEKKDALGERMSVDHLSMICTSAVRESLANVFGVKFDCFVRDFEKSFGSTLRTLRLINESFLDSEECQICHHNAKSSSARSLKKGGCANKGCGCTNAAGVNDSYSQVISPNIATRNQLHDVEEAEEDVPTDSNSQQLALCGQINQVACISRGTLDSVHDQSVISTFEKSIMEQVRSNDLKTMELGLTMRRLKLKETQLALNSDLNHLERSKLAMGISKASFKVEKFKNQVEDMKHIELLRMCTDFLVAGLVIMLASLAYGAYVYSYQRISEATTSCSSLPLESKSWWIPNPMASFKSGLHIIWCQVQVLSRMLFAFLMIFAICFLLVQRSATSKQTMPITFILLLLGVACGFAGKICVDTLGGSGYHWLLYWETMCLLHFFSNICTSTLFLILHGPVTVTQCSRSNAIFPYWVRRYLYYSMLLLLLPLLCGLMPFASPAEWKNHFSMLVTDYLSTDGD